MPEPAPAQNLSTPRSAWRRCLLLCLPALIIGTVLRISIFLAIPQGYYGPDSNSYFDTASGVWLHHEWDFGPKRRWVYPLLLIPAPAVPGQTVTTVAIAQHLLGLITILGVGWIVMHLTRRPQIWVPLVTILVAIWPRMLRYEQEIVAECLLLASIVLAIALTFPVGALRDRKRLFWFLMAAALVIAVKPHGRPVWMALMLSAVLLAGAPWRWGKACFCALGLSAVIILSTGSSRQGPWLLLSSTLPLVDTEHGKWPEYRKILAPSIEESRVDLSQYPWIQDKYKKKLTDGGDTGFGPEWQELLKVKDKKKTKFLNVCRDLAVDAIEHHPVTYARMVLQKIGMVLTDTSAWDILAPRYFWAGQVKDNEDRWQKHPDEMKLLYKMDEGAYETLATEQRKTKAWYEPYFYHFSQYFAWMRVIGRAPRTLHPAWFGLLAVFGFLTCLRPSRWRETAPLYLSLGFFLVIIFSIGDSVARYLQPVEWIGIVFVALGLDWLLAWVWSPKEEPLNLNPNLNLNPSVIPTEKEE